MYMQGKRKRKLPTRLDMEGRFKLYRDWARGTRAEAIAVRHDVSYSTVYRMMRPDRVSKRGRKY